MPRAPALLVLVLAAATAAGLLCAPHMHRPAEPVVNPATPTATRGGKPLAPFDIELVAGPSAGAGPVSVSFTIRPLCALQSVTWAWKLSTSLVLLDGAVSGTALPLASEATTSAATLLLPPPSSFAEAELVVTGTFAGHDDAGHSSLETVRASRRLSWGDLPVLAPTVTTTDGATGEPLEVIALPVTWEAP